MQFSRSLDLISFVYLEHSCYELFPKLPDGLIVANSTQVHLQNDSVELTSHGQGESDSNVGGGRTRG